VAFAIVYVILFANCTVNSFVFFIVIFILETRENASYDFFNQKNHK